MARRSAFILVWTSTAHPRKPLNWRPRELLFTDEYCLNGRRQQGRRKRQRLRLLEQRGHFFLFFFFLFMISAWARNASARFLMSSAAWESTVRAATRSAARACLRNCLAIFMAHQFPSLDGSGEPVARSNGLVSRPMPHRYHRMDCRRIRRPAGGSAGGLLPVPAPDRQPSRYESECVSSRARRQDGANSIRCSRDAVHADAPDGFRRRPIPPHATSSSLRSADVQSFRRRT